MAVLWKVASCLLAQAVLELSGPSLGSHIDGRVFNDTTYSVIIEANNRNPCSQFADLERVRFFTRPREVSVQFTRYLPDANEPLNLRQHPDGVAKRVRIVFIMDKAKNEISRYPNKVRHKNKQTTLSCAVHR